MTPTIEALGHAVDRVLDDYFPDAEPGSLFIGEDEGRTKAELRTDLLAAVLEELLP